MSIPQSRYVNISTVVGGSSQAPERQYIARLFTNNPILPPQTFLEFSNIADVGTYFGVTSNEYYRAAFYFSFANKNGPAPQVISFARWVSADQAPSIVGASVTGGQLYTRYTSIDDGSFGLTINGQYYNIDTLDFTAATSLANVATILQAGIRSETGGGAMWTDATVTYSSANGGIFIFTGGVEGAATISVQQGVGGTDISATIGWLPQAVFTQGSYSNGSIVSMGSLAENPVTTVTASASLSNNFGSFAFIPAIPLTLDQNVAVATWNATQNGAYIFQIPVVRSNVDAWVLALSEIRGVGLSLTVDPIVLNGTTASTNTISGILSTANLTIGMQVTGTGIPDSTTIVSITNLSTIVISNAATNSATEALTFYPVEFIEMLPMAIQASTNYNAANTVQNYEFQKAAGLTPTVFTTEDADYMDSKSINYYGQTQTAGQLLSFYQKGVLMGLPTDPIQMGTYANETWLKDAISSSIMTLFLSLGQVSASKVGASQIRAIIQDNISQALSNGTISVGKPFDLVQKAYISNITNDTNAWRQVQNSGYWLNVAIIIKPNTSPVQYQAAYTLVYSKDDTIDFVSGVHDLI